MKNLSKKLVFSVLSTSICLVTGSTVYSVDITDKNITGTLDNVNYKTGLKVNYNSRHNGLNISSLTISPDNPSTSNRAELPGYGNRAIVAERLQDFNVTGDLIIGTGNINEEGKVTGSADEGILIGRVLDNIKDVRVPTNFGASYRTMRMRTSAITGENLKAYVGGNFLTHTGANENEGSLRFELKKDVEIYNTLKNVKDYLFKIKEDEGFGISAKNIRIIGSENEEGGIIDKSGSFGLDADSVYTKGNISANKIYLNSKDYLEHKGNINGREFYQIWASKNVKIFGNSNSNEFNWKIDKNLEHYGDITGHGKIVIGNTLNVNGNINLNGTEKKLEISANDDAYIKGININNGAKLYLNGNFTVDTVKGDDNNTILSAEQRLDMPSTEGISKLEIGAFADTQVVYSASPYKPIIVNKPKNGGSLINIYKLSDKTKLSLINRKEDGNKELLNWDADAQATINRLNIFRSGHISRLSITNHFNNLGGKQIFDGYTNQSVYNPVKKKLRGRRGSFNNKCG